MLDVGQDMVRRLAHIEVGEQQRAAGHDVIVTRGGRVEDTAGDRNQFDDRVQRRRRRLQAQVAGGLADIDAEQVGRCIEHARGGVLAVDVEHLAHRADAADRGDQDEGVPDDLRCGEARIARRPLTLPSKTTGPSLSPLGRGY